MHFASALAFFFSDLAPFLVMVVLMLLLAILWVFQFVALMSLEDEELPGEHARIGWVAAFLVLWPVAPFAFMLWRYRAAVARTDRKSEGPPPPLSSRRRSIQRRAARRAQEEAEEAAGEGAGEGAS